MCAGMSHRGLGASWRRLMWLATACAILAAQSGFSRRCTACDVLGRDCCDTGRMGTSGAATERLPIDGSSFDSAPGCPLCRAQAAGGHRHGVPELLGREAESDVAVVDVACVERGGPSEEGGGCGCQLVPREQRAATAGTLAASIDESDRQAVAWPHAPSPSPAGGHDWFESEPDRAGAMPRPARILFGVWRN